VRRTRRKLVCISFSRRFYVYTTGSSEKGAERSLACRVGLKDQKDKKKKKKNGDCRANYARWRNRIRVHNWSVLRVEPSKQKLVDGRE